jgi:uncharacterized protein (TIGR00369 family)
MGLIINFKRMKKIHNPFIGHPPEEYNCFGCSPGNELGLQLEFFDTGEQLITHWQPKEWLVGYTKILHGGIVATLMDEMAGWVVLTKSKTAGVTSRMEVEYLKPVFITRGAVEVRGWPEKIEERETTIHCELYDGEGVCCAKAHIVYFCYPEEIARRRFHYPGVDAFYL